MTAHRDYKIAAIDRALSVLKFLGERPDTGVTEISTGLGLNKSQVFRILQTLEARGFVARDPDDANYALGFQMSALGARAGGQSSLVAVCAPVMDELRDSTAENVNLVVREGSRALVLASREGHYSMRLFAQAGRYGPLHAGGASMVLLAFAPKDLQKTVLSAPLASFTPATCTNAKTLKQRLAMIRANGYHISQDDFEEGAFSISAPIHSHAGEVIAAISVAGAKARLDKARTASHRAAVLEASSEICRRIGFDGLAAQKVSQTA
ncbi:MAG: IclR family transcriptional regulator [Pseudomonadota bacterium]